MGGLVSLNILRGINEAVTGWGVSRRGLVAVSSRRQMKAQKLKVRKLFISEEKEKGHRFMSIYIGFWWF